MSGGLSGLGEVALNLWCDKLIERLQTGAQKMPLSQVSASYGCNIARNPDDRTSAARATLIPKLPETNVRHPVETSGG